MQLNVTTDYAVRIVLYLASKKDYANSYEISSEMGIPHSYILKITKVLKDAKIISEKRGINGGFILTKKPENISIMSILILFEKTMQINRCLEKDKYCSRNAAGYCKVRESLSGVQTALDEMLSVKISEFL